MMNIWNSISRIWDLSYVTIRLCSKPNSTYIYIYTQTAKTQRSNHGIYAQYLVSNNNATLNLNSYEHIATMCTFPTHTPNTTYTYFLIWDSIMRIDIEMLDRRLSGVCSHEIQYWYLVRFPIRIKYRHTLKARAPWFWWTNHDFLNAYVAVHPTQYYTLHSALTRTHERWPSAKRVSSVG